MVNNAVIIPVATLGTICVCMFVFMFWFFPRAWAKGVASDQAEWDEAKRRRELAEETAVETDVELGNVAGEGGQGNGNPARTAPPVPRMPARYVPPVTPY